MSQKVTEVFHYTETNNPYANGEEIAVTLIENDNNEKYFEFFVKNYDEFGCGVYLTPNQVVDLINQLKLKIE